MRILRTIIIIASVAGSICSCSLEPKSPASFVDYLMEMDSLEALYNDIDTAGKVVDFCHLFNKSPWDSIIVVREYLPGEYFREIDFCGQWVAKDSMEHVTHVDWLCGLMFTKNGCVTSYSVIDATIDFSHVAGYDKMVPILPRSQCKVRIRNSPLSDGTPGLYFYPLVLSKEDLEYKRRSDDYDRTHRRDSVLRDL